MLYKGEAMSKSFKYQGRLLVVEEGVTYRNGRLAVQLWSNGPYATLSVNVPEIDISIDKQEFIVNHDVRDELWKAGVEQGIFEDTGRRVDYGWVRGRPVLRLK